MPILQILASKTAPLFSHHHLHFAIRLLHLLMSFCGVAKMALKFRSDTSLSIFPIEKFPDEILGLILVFVRSASIKEFVPVLRVSRKWYQIGEDLVWRGVVLTRENLPQFVSNVQKWQHRSHLSQRIRSLTIKIDPSVQGHSQAFRKAVDHLAQLLPAMSSLKTFSFFNQHDISDPWASWDIRNEFTTSLIRCLPDSVENLEINSPYIHFWSDYSNEDCLCSVISARINGLRCLRLAYPRICPRLLLWPSSTLEYLSINPTKPDLGPSLRECQVADSYTRLSWDEVQAQKSLVSKVAFRGLLDNLSDDALVKERFPSIRQLNIIESCHFKLLSTQQWLLLKLHRLRRDPNDSTGAIQITTGSYPVWPTGFIDPENRDPYQFILRRCLHNSSDEVPDHQCYSSDIVGYSVEICNALEGITGWVSDSTSSRRPRYLLSSSATNMFTNPAFLSKNQWETRYAMHRTQHLLEVVSQKGLEVHPDEQRCDSWSEIQQFRGRYGVKPKEAGADMVWYLEDQLGHSALWGRTFDWHFPQSADEVDQSEFSTSFEALLQVHVDSDIAEQSEDDDDDVHETADIRPGHRTDLMLINVTARQGRSRISDIAGRLLFGTGR